MTSTHRFVGRARERVDLAARLAEGSLVTIVGTAGVGKTRLALEAAEEHLRTTGVRAIVCELSSAETLEDVGRVVARALDLPSLGADAVARIRAALAARPRHLLVLDNFEHLTDLAPTTVAHWMAASTEGRVLVTSRDRLGIAGESILALEPLPLPPEGDDALELLLARAGIAAASRSPRETAALEAIVRELDGLPLAIELAAARLGVLTPEELLRLLPRQLDVLTKGPRGGPSRHQTLRASIDWSWNLLGEEEQACLAHCSVFRGGFALEAVAALLDVDPVVALDRLHALHDHSLVRVESTSAGTRFSLLTSIRAFAAERLVGVAQTRAKSRFVAHYEGLARASRAETDRRGIADPSEGVRAELFSELENLAEAARTAVADATTPRALTSAFELVLALGLAVTIRGPFAAYARMLDDLLSRVTPAIGTHPEHVDALVMRARVRRLQGDLAGAVSDARRATELADAESEQASAGRAFAMLGLVETDGGRYDDALRHYGQARALLAGNTCAEAALLVEVGDVERLRGNTREASDVAEHALRLFRAEGDRRGVGRALNLLAIALTNEARHDEAATAYLEAITIFEELGDRRLAAMARGNLAMLQQDRMQFPDAMAHYQSAITALGELGDVATRASYVALSGTLLHELGRVAEARALYENALDEFRRIGQPRSICLGLAHLGAALAGLDRVDAATAAFDEADAILEKLGDRLGRISLDVHRAHLDLARGDRQAVERRRARGLAGQHESQQIRRALRLLERVCPPRIDPAALVVGREGAWFRAPGQPPVDLTKRVNLRRLVARLVEARLQTPGVLLEAPTLVLVGWPGERIQPAAARVRLRVALTTLRKLGLHDVLRSTRHGWCLLPEIDVVSLQSAEPPSFE